MGRGGGHEQTGGEETLMKMPNKPDAVNPAIACRFDGGDHWRGVADPGRSAELFRADE